MVAFGKPFIDLVEYLAHPPPRCGLDVHVGAQGVNIMAYAPDMEAVDALHPSGCVYLPYHVVQLDVLGHPLEEYMGGFLQYLEYAEEYYADYGEAYEGVDYIPLRIVDYDRGYYDPHGGRGVPDDVKKGALYVEVALGKVPEPERHREVHHETHDGHSEHTEARHGLGVEDPCVGLVEYEERYEEEGKAVYKGDEDLCPVEPVGPLFRRREPGDVYGEEAQREGEHVHEDVRGVGHQREAVGEITADDLRDEYQPGKRYGKGEPAL